MCSTFRCGERISEFSHRIKMQWNYKTLKSSCKTRSQGLGARLVSVATQICFVPFNLLAVCFEQRY